MLHDGALLAIHIRFIIRLAPIAKSNQKAVLIIKVENGKASGLLACPQERWGRIEKDFLLRRYDFIAPLSAAIELSTFVGNILISSQHGERTLGLGYPPLWYLLLLR